MSRDIDIEKAQAMLDDLKAKRQARKLIVLRQGNTRRWIWLDRIVEFTTWTIEGSPRLRLYYHGEEDYELYEGIEAMEALNAIHEAAGSPVYGSKEIDYWPGLGKYS